MEHECSYTTLKASYGQNDLILSGPKEGSFHITCGCVVYTVDIGQGPGRQITVCADKPVYWSQLIGPLYVVERLLMIFDGVFVRLQDIGFTGSLNGDCEGVESAQVYAQRPSYFATSAHFTIHDKLVDWDSVLTDELIVRWQGLLDELDIANQMYLYDISDSGMPVDLRLAFLVELAEPLVEVVNKERNLFPSLNPGESGTSLKQCLEALVNTYGRIVFAREMQHGFDDCLNKLVKSRVRIMHIKTNQPESKYYDGRHSLYYMLKLSLLYRTALFELLGLPSGIYEERLRKRTEDINRWFEELQRSS